MTMIRRERVEREGQRSTSRTHYRCDGPDCGAVAVLDNAAPTDEVQPVERWASIDPGLDERLLHFCSVRCLQAKVATLAVAADECPAGGEHTMVPVEGHGTGLVAVACQECGSTVNA